jgi:U3 small nucleolar RNA-associated protein 13
MAYTSSLSKQFNVDPEEHPDSVEIQNLQLKGDTLYVMNGDQNLFVYKINQKHQQMNRLDLQWSNCLFMDEIIDSKFINGNKFALMCSNSETLKLMDLSSGQMEIYPGHSDIIITLDVFCINKNSQSEAEKGYLISGSKDNLIRLWRYDFSKPIYSRIECLAVYEGHTHNISSVHFAPKKGRQFVSSSVDNTIKVWNCQQFMGEEYETNKPVNVKQADMTVMAH